MLRRHLSSFFFFNDTATTEIYTLSLHDALPICPLRRWMRPRSRRASASYGDKYNARFSSNAASSTRKTIARRDRKSTRLNSSHVRISYAVFCLKKNNLKDVAG